MNNIQRYTPEIHDEDGKPSIHFKFDQNGQWVLHNDLHKPEIQKDFNLFMVSTVKDKPDEKAIFAPRKPELPKNPEINLEQIIPGPTEQLQIETEPYPLLIIFKVPTQEWPNFPLKDRKPDIQEDLTHLTKAGIEEIILNYTLHLNTGRLPGIQGRKILTDIMTSLKWATPETKQHATTFIQSWIKNIKKLTELTDNILNWDYTGNCPIGGKHHWGTDGQHNNEFCKNAT